MGAKEYSGDQVTLTHGPILAQGLADGDFARLEWVTDSFSTVVGTDGELTFNKSNDKRARLTLILMQTSACNDKLTALHNADLLAGNGAGIVPTLLRDRNGRALYTSVESRIVKRPNVTYGREAGPREWVIEGLFEGFDGGN